MKHDQLQRSPLFLWHYKEQGQDRLLQLYVLGNWPTFSLIMGILWIATFIDFLLALFIYLFSHRRRVRMGISG